MRTLRQFSEVSYSSIERTEATESQNRCGRHIFQRKWVVLMAALLSQGLGAAFVFSLSVFYVDIMETFDVNRSQAAWVASLAGGMSQVFGIIGGMFVNVLGCRMTTIIGGIIACLGLVVSAFATSVFYLYISFGITLGFATTLQFNAPIASVCEYFTEGRARALTVVMMGPSVGSMLHPLLFEGLTDIYTWRGALVVLAGVMLNMCVLGSLMKPLRLQLNNPQSPAQVLKLLLDMEVFKSRPYLVYLLARFMLGFGVALMYTIMVDFAISKGCTRETGLMLIVYYNVGNTCGRFLACVIQIKQTVLALDLLIISALVLGVTFLIYPWALTFDHLLVISIFNGVALGVVAGTFAAIPAQVIDPKLFPTAFGLQTTAHGVSILLAPPLTGWMADTTGSYNWSLAVIGCCVLVGMVLCVIVRIMLSRLETSAKITDERTRIFANSNRG